MTNYNSSFKSFAVNEMQANATKIRAWANSSDNPLLSALAKEVIEASQKE